MSEIYKPRVYQDYTTNFIVENELAIVDGAGVFLDMGLGKTAATSTAINILMFETFDIQKPLIIAPKLVAEHTWSDEFEKWQHLNHLKLVKILGTEKQRKQALKEKGDVYIINRENVAWLVSHYGLSFPFDMLVIDELSSFKNKDAVRFKALQSIRPKIRRVVGLTGTPAPKGLLDLWSQIYLLDRGKRLEKTYEGYRQRYFRKDPHKPFANYEVVRDNDEEIGKGHYEKKIYSKISDICISMKKEDWLEMPELINVTKEVHLKSETQALYEEFERENVLKLADLGEEISTPNAAALINKLLQFSNGAVYYDDQRNFYEVHNEKLEMLEEVVEAANGNPILVTYQFQSDVERIKRHLKAFKPIHIKEGKNILADWNKGKIPVLLGHAASMGHGLNMQFGGHLVADFGAGWSLELWQQVINRIHRPGVLENVIRTSLVCKDTYEMKVLDRLEGRAIGQETLMQAVKALIKKHTGIFEAA